MRDLAYRLLFGRQNLFSGAAALSIIVLMLLGCTCGKNFDFGNISSGNSNSSSSSNSNSVFGGDEDNNDVDDTLAKATVKATTAEFANAINTGDFSSLYNECSTEFRSQYSEEQLKSEFSAFISQKRNVLPILAKAMSMEPEYTEGPSTRSEANQTVLTAAGKYATRPLPVTFHYEYVKREGKWWILRLEVYVK